MDYITPLSQVYLLIIFLVIVLGYASFVMIKNSKTPNLLIIPLIAGILLKFLLTKSVDVDIYELSPIFLVLTGVTLVFLAFDYSAKPAIKHFDTVHSISFRLFITQLLLNMFLVTIFVTLITGIPILYALLFALIITSTTPLLFDHEHDKVKEILQKEALIATPILLVLAYFIYDVIAIQNNVVHFFAPSITPYFMELLVGAGVGLLFGIVFFNTITRFHKNNASTIMTMLSAIGAYVLTEFLGGDGIVGTAVFGMFFGNMHVANKEKTDKFLEKILQPLIVIMLVMLGLMIGIEFSFDIIIKSLAIFFLVMIVRYVAVQMIFHPHHSNREKTLLVLNTQHSTALIPIILLLILRKFEGLGETVSILSLTLIYAMITAIIISKIYQKRAVKQ